MNQDYQTFQIPEEGQPVVRPAEAMPNATHPEQQQAPVDAAPEADSTTDVMIEQIRRVGLWLDHHRANKLQTSTGYDLGLVGIWRKLSGSSPSKRKLMRREAEFGSTVFGPAAKNHHRDFFYFGKTEDGYDEWVWHEHVPGADGKPVPHTTYYEVQPTRIIKKQSNQLHKPTKPSEIQTLHQATAYYLQLVESSIYN